MIEFSASIIRQVFESFGEIVSGIQSLTGGDINHCYKITTANGFFFLKLNKAKAFPGMFAAEANGLKMLQQNFSLKVPEVFAQGQIDDTQFLVLEWIERERPAKNFWKDFGEALANLHRVTQPAFGSHPNNYIGSLVQINANHQSWPEFYAQCRILPLVKRLHEDALISKQEMVNAEAFCKHLPGIFPDEPPALLHGDLWNGNFMAGNHGNACIYDPAVYYGHREMEMGMTKLFGGFGTKFYEAYNEAYPLEKEWQSRISITQLYPILVHALLFGGHYVSQAMEILRERK